MLYLPPARHAVERADHSTPRPMRLEFAHTCMAQLRGPLLLVLGPRARRLLPFGGSRLGGRARPNHARRRQTTFPWWRASIPDTGETESLPINASSGRGGTWATRAVCAQLWDNYGTTMGQLWGNYGTTMGQLWDNYGTTYGTTHGTTQKPTREVQLAHYHAKKEIYSYLF